MTANPLRFYAAALALALTFSNLAHLAQAATPASKGPGAAERDWLQARDAFDKRDLAALTAARDRFAARGDHPLAPYPAYWWLTAQLGASAQNARNLSREIEQFLAANEDGPLAEPLLRDTLRALGKIDHWPQFTKLSTRYVGDDPEVQCQRMRQRFQGEDLTAIKRAEDEARGMFNLAKSAPEACYEVFERIARKEKLSSDELWLRTRRLFDAGQLADARRTAQLIPGLPNGFEASSASANLDAKRFLQKQGPRAGNRPSVELALFAVTRLARTDAGDAAQWLERNAGAFPESALAHAWGNIGHHAAMQLNPNALEWFSRAGVAPSGATLNDTQAGWWVRAALRATATDATQWATVKRAIAAMTDAERREPVWRYWQARALQMGKDPMELNTARQLREALAREDGFYSVLAAEEIGALPPPNFVGSEPTPAAVAEVARKRGIVRAIAMFRLTEFKADVRFDAIREWHYAIRNMDDLTLLAAAEVGKQNDLPDRAINTAGRTKTLHHYGERYPVPHRAPLTAQAQQFGLDPAWVYGLIRQESRFMTDARSRVGALGLMQLMPATAKWSAKQVGIKDYSVDRVVDVPVNLSLGSYYLRHVLDDLGHPVLATAAYNAGPGRARRWRAESPLEGAIYAESIPFNETRDYVKQVMLNRWYYGYRLNGKSPPLSELMGVVPGKSQASPIAVANLSNR